MKSNDDILKKIEKLYNLKEKGAITEEEFEKLKSELLKKDSVNDHRLKKQKIDKEEKTKNTNSSKEYFENILKDDKNNSKEKSSQSLFDIIKSYFGSKNKDYKSNIDSEKEVSSFNRKDINSNINSKKKYDFKKILLILAAIFIPIIGPILVIRSDKFTKVGKILAGILIVAYIIPYGNFSSISSSEINNSIMFLSPSKRFPKVFCSNLNYAS
ncbi:MAG: SHOCT domain-containing protein [Halanaerobiales bacterium]|nr:SHOCT domain-containing protein [Halanaerobiales bacterium]